MGQEKQKTWVFVRDRCTAHMRMPYLHIRRVPFFLFTRESVSLRCSLTTASRRYLAGMSIAWRNPSSSRPESPRASTGTRCSTLSRSLTTTLAPTCSKVQNKKGVGVLIPTCLPVCCRMRASNGPLSSFFHPIPTGAGGKRRQKSEKILSPSLCPSITSRVERRSKASMMAT